MLILALKGFIERSDGMHLPGVGCLNCPTIAWRIVYSFMFALYSLHRAYGGKEDK